MQARAEGRAAAGARPDGGRGKLRRRRLDLRLAGDRSGARARGGRARRADAAARAAPRPARGRDRLARLRRPRLVVGAQHGGLVAQPVPAAGLQRPRLGRLRLDDRARRRRRDRRVRRDGARARGRSASSTRGRSCSRSPRGSWWAASRSRSPRRRTEPTTAVLFSGESAFGSLFDSAATISLTTLALLLLFKGLAWSVSLGNFRGGPTFPAHLPRRRRRPDGGAPAGLRGDAGRRGARRARRAWRRCGCRSRRR